MSFLSVNDLHIDLGQFSLKGVSLDLKKGDYLAVMGPTGSGKTILLECIIGFYKPKQGHIFLEGRDITDEKPEKRRIGIVYQDYALLPHLTVFKNIEYGLKKIDAGKESRRAKIIKMAESLNISHILHRKPETLSGGEQQRTALARALVVEPKLLLMDEPLSALDPKTRHNIRSLLRKTIEKLDITVLHITHDMDDVWSMANKVAIFKNGELLQHNTREQVFNCPESSFLADFVGAVIYDGKVVSNCGGKSLVDIQGLELSVVENVKSDPAVKVALRPENVMVFREKPTDAFERNIFEATLDDFYHEGNLCHLSYSSKGVRIPVMMMTNSFYEMDLKKDQSSFLAIRSHDLRIL
ncbi:ABC transporter ATP-binding protein [Maridesulfovibrio ferrireducens]|uniref:ABC transporter ATP-binding protein n=1 Tax=Maridesulfovibrio ferrireducens TaxID=246191 RepID=UPI001A25F0BF|nr:ATP-binding cassette domain-containing protein [Maridesulfovibrio ferrireducens]MBI9111133.1 ATP-binding cassette domain-containing protein [Maridesulfovibrio ferrireducens]